MVEQGRVLGDLGPRDRGPTLIVVSGIHGNERAGVRASRRVIDALAARPRALRGRVLFLAGNLTALETGARFVDRDLNRAWTRSRIASLRNGGAPSGADAAVEDREQAELMDRLEEGITEARGPVYVLDLHTTSGEGGAFTTVADTLGNRRLALELPVPLVLGLEELVEGTLHEFLNELGCITLAFESGQHDEREAEARAAAGIWIVLAATGVLAESDAPELPEARKRLAREGREHPRVVEMRYRHPVRAEDAFRMAPGYRNFQRIEEGEVLAHDRSGAVRAPESARILMPLYQTQGEDGFFVVREFRPFWLHVSAGMRRAGLDRIVHWLPGIRRHPGRDDALVVDRGLARWAAIQVLHLLGYRRHEEEGDRLIVVRQKRHRELPTGRPPAGRGRPGPGDAA